MSLSPHLKFPAHRFSLACAAPWDIIESPSPASLPGFLWRGRDENDVWLGLGWAGVFGSLAECREALRVVDVEAGAPDFAPRCFAVCAFDVSASLVAPWESFQPRLFVLPETLIRWRDERADVMLIRPVFGSATHDDLRSEFEAATAQAKVLLQNSAPRRPLVLHTRELLFDEASWTHAVQRLQQEIAQNRLRKIVLARSQKFTANHPWNSAEPLFRMAQTERGCFMFAHRMNQSVFLGAAPERLFRLYENNLEVDSVAGTRPRGKTATEDQGLSDELLRSTKDGLEQQIITDFLSEHLATWSAQRVQVSARHVLKLEHVQHLASTLSVEISSDVEPDRILTALHPTPAVCGLPRKEALMLLREIEPEPRGLYAGAIGWVSLAEIQMAVAIRSALLCGATARLFAGAGIVADSDAHREWEEAQWKMQPMMQALGIANR